MANEAGSESIWTRFNPNTRSSETASFHFHDDELITAINVALAIGRPLFLRGIAGVGKSSVAEGTKRHLGWSLRSCTVSSRMSADDLKYTFDAVRRLADAQAAANKGPLQEELSYVRPGPLWWAFDPAGAARQAERYIAAGGGLSSTNGADHDRGRVLLIDEIDKAEPDLPNDLLDVFGARQFEGPFGAGPVVLESNLNLLVVITSNQERDMPAAFLRRCIPHELKRPKANEARQIAVRHMDIADERESQAGKRLSDEDIDLVIQATVTADGDIDAAAFVDLLDAMRATWAESPKLTAQDMLAAFKPIFDKRSADVEKAHKG